MKFRVKAILFYSVSFLLLIVIIIYALNQTNEWNLGKLPYCRTEIKKSPPVFARLVGGLGNQLFQYAAAYSVAKKRNSDIYIFTFDETEPIVEPMISAYNSKYRKYLLNQFNVPQDKILPADESAHSQNYNHFDEIKLDLDYYLEKGKVHNHTVTDEDLLTGDVPDDKVLLVGDYFESDVFFESDKPDILNLFQPTFDTQPIEHLKLLISSTENSVSVHIRRGDFSYQHDFRLISLSYQREAMQLVKEKLQTNNVTFFVFTDDLDYVKKHLDDGQNRIMYMSDFTGDNTLYDFVLMSLCKHNIITNSTFSWWAAYLNKNPHKIVVGPMPRYPPEWIDENFPNNSDKKLITDLAYPKGWLTIAPKFLNSSDHE